MLPHALPVQKTQLGQDTVESLFEHIYGMVACDILVGRSCTCRLDLEPRNMGFSLALQSYHLDACIHADGNTELRFCHYLS